MLAVSVAPERSTHTAPITVGAATTLSFEGFYLANERRLFRALSVVTGSRDEAVDAASQLRLNLELDDGVDDQHVADDDVAGLAHGGALEVQSVPGGLAEAGAELLARLLGVDHDGLDALALAAAPGAGGLSLLPYLDGERTPDRPTATGVLTGLRSDVTREQLARAAVVSALLALLLAVHWLVMDATYAASLEGRRRSAGGPDRDGPDRRRLDRRGAGPLTTLRPRRGPRAGPART